MYANAHRELVGSSSTVGSGYRKSTRKEFLKEKKKVAGGKAYDVRFFLVIIYII